MYWAGVSNFQKELEFDGRLATLQGSANPQGVEDNTGRGITNMMKVIEQGNEAQKSLVLFELQQIINHSNSKEDAFNHLIPVICKLLPSWSHDLQICAAESLAGLTRGMITVEAASSIANAAFAVLRQQQDPDMFRLWGQILVEVLPLVKWTEDQMEQILSQVDDQQKRGKLSQNLSRKLTARIIGPMAVATTPEIAERILLTRALNLTKERNVEIKGMVVESMALIGSVLETRTVEQQLWPSLAALADDSNVRLHAATLRSVARIAAAHRNSTGSAEFFGTLLAPVFAKECHFIRKTAQLDQRYVGSDVTLLLEINAEIFGELLYSCHQSLASDFFRKEALKAFQTSSVCNTRIVRRHCAFNVPGIALSFAKYCRAEVGVVVETLSRDSDAETRWTLAAGLHETAKVLCCNDTFDNLFKAVSALIHDKHGLVRMKIFQNLDTLLGILTTHNPYKAISRLESVFQNLQHLSEGNWRTQELLASQLKIVASLVPPKCIRQSVLPLLFQLIYQSPYTVRKAAMGAVAVCLRCLPDTNERDEVMESFVVQWGQGTAWWMRLGFIDSAEMALDTYSRILFRDTYAARLLQLAQDPVPNVRIKTARLMHKIAPACHQMEEFDVAYRALKEDNDTDVRQALDGLESRIVQSVEEFKNNIEDDMLRETEEQGLYTKHLKLQAEVKKKQAGMKHKTNAFIVRAKRVGGVVGGIGEASLSTPRSSQTPTSSNCAFAETARGDVAHTKGDSPQPHGNSVASTRLPKGVTVAANGLLAEVGNMLSPKPGFDRSQTDRKGVGSFNESSETSSSPCLGLQKIQLPGNDFSAKSDTNSNRRCQALNLATYRDSESPSMSSHGVMMMSSMNLSPRAKNGLNNRSSQLDNVAPDVIKQPLGSRSTQSGAENSSRAATSSAEVSSSGPQGSSLGSNREAEASPASFRKTFILNSHLTKHGCENSSGASNVVGGKPPEEKEKKRHANSRNSMKTFITMLSPRSHQFDSTGGNKS